MGSEMCIRDRLKGTQIINHLRRRATEMWHTVEGIKFLGGKKSSLHKQSPFKERWALMKNGDLWQTFTRMVGERGPETIAISKVKGHATDAMVNAGEVRRFDQIGNDSADKAADRGATVSQARVQAFGRTYCQRHLAYRALMCRIQSYTVGLKKEERKLVQDQRRARDPFETRASKLVSIPAKLRYPTSRAAFGPTGEGTKEEDGPRGYATTNC